MVGKSYESELPVVPDCDYCDKPSSVTIVRLSKEYCVDHWHACGVSDFDMMLGQSVLSALRG